VEETKQEKPKKVVIVRATWVRGTCLLGPGNPTYDERGISMLLNDKGRRCCLGFVGQQLCEVTDDEAKTSYYPSNRWVLQKFHQHLPGLFKDKLLARGIGAKADLSEVCNDIVAVNDTQALTDEEREKKLIELFKKIDVEIEFVD